MNAECIHAVKIMLEAILGRTERSIMTFHHHEAKYVDGVLVRECNHCCEDLMHESHLRSPNHYTHHPNYPDKPLSIRQAAERIGRSNDEYLG